TDVLSFSQDGVELKDSAELSADVTAAIASISQTPRGLRLKMHDKMAALSLLADFFGIRDDFNKARATLKRYGLAMVEDSSSETGWKLERHIFDEPEQI
ncbi:MAG: hypothetical protein WBA10_01285, partial [Elainellaceae cyanobacterium]